MLRIACLYGPVWLVIMITIALYIRIGLYIYSRLKQFREVQTSTDLAEDINRIAQTSNPETYEMTQAPSTPDQYPRQAAESGISVQRTATEHSIRTHSRDLVRTGSDSNMAAWAYARYSFLFFLALLVTWVRYILLLSILYCD